jgi:magnesium chelatase family protein
MDRMALCARFTNDIHMNVRRVPFDKLASLDGGESPATNRARVETARAVQAERFAGLGKANMMVNGDMGLAEVQPAKQLDAQGKELLRAAARPNA